MSVAAPKNHIVGLSKTYNYTTKIGVGFLTRGPGSFIIAHALGSAAALKIGQKGWGNLARRKRSSNNVRLLREELLLSKAELARRADVSPITVDRVERGETCRLDTKRKIILALEKKLSEKEHVFPDLAKNAPGEPNREDEEN